VGGKKPKTIFINQNQVMAQAIAWVLNGTCHLLYEWHIEKNATKNIPYYARLVSKLYSISYCGVVKVKIGLKLFNNI
jgi:hypothetical protein